MRWRRTVVVLRSLLVALILAAVAWHSNGSSEGSYKGAFATAVKDNASPVRRPVQGRSLAFEINQGQTDERVKFLSRTAGYSIFLGDDDVLFAFDGSREQSHAVETVTARNTDARIHPAAIRMRLAGARRPSSLEGLDPLPGKANYFIGSDSRRWRTGVATYERVRYNRIYTGIDLVYHGNEGQLEYDFVLAPGADARAIRLSFEGADDLRLDSNGDLVILAAGREIRQQKPYAYQDKDGTRREVACEYVIGGRTQAAFALGEYDHSRPLILDPVLFYSTYLGGSDYDGGPGVPAPAIAVDNAGNAYVTGLTASIDFPTVGGLGRYPTTNEAYDVYISKFDPEGAIVYSTYLGGSRSDESWAIAVDVLGDAYVAGGTDSPDFPTTQGTVPTCTPIPDNRCVGRGFVTKLAPSGSSLVYSTLLGGGDPIMGVPTVATAVALDATLNVFIAGGTGSGLAATPGAFQTEIKGRFDGFVAKLNRTGTSLMFVTYLGGTLDDSPHGVAVDRFGNTYVAGTTRSDDFPTTPGAFQRSCPVVEIVGGCSIAFVAKVNATGTALVYSTYLGGSGTITGVALRGVSSEGNGIVIDAAGHSYVTGTTFTTDFPTTAGALSETSGGLQDAFVTKLSADGAALEYSTYLGGSDEDFGQRIAIDRSQNVYVTGATASADFPAVSPIQPTLAGGIFDAFAAKLNATGDALIYSTYLGGTGPGPVSGQDWGSGIAVDAAGTAYVTGTTASTDLPTTNAAQPTFGGGLTDAFVAKIGDRTCGTDVSDQVVVLQSPFYTFLFPSLRLQLVFVYNKSSMPIDGPLVLIEDNLQNAVALNVGPTTGCFMGPASPIVFLDVGSDSVLGPNQAVLTGLLFYQPQPLPISYTAHVVSGIPTQ